jgi:predicted permease
MKTTARPPFAAVRLLEWCVAADDADEIIGDLLQTFRDRLDRGLSWNRAWLWTQALVFAAAALASGRRAGRPDWTPPSPIERSSLMDRVVSRLRDAVRHLRHDWRYAGGVVAILAAGLGPAAAMLSVVETVLVRPLDYEDPERLAMVRIDLDTLRGHPGLSPAESLDLGRSGLFSAVETQTRLAEVTLAEGDRLTPLSQMGMTPGTLRMLGVAPVRGRAFTEDDFPPPPPQTPPGTLPAAPPPPPRQVALVDFDTWQSRFGGDETVLGRVVQVDGRPTEIVGVLPRGFRLATGRAVPQRVDLYTPLQLRDFRNAWQFPTIARLPAGASYAQTQQALDALAASLKQKHPEFYPGALRFTIAPVLDDMTQASRPALRAALAGVLLLLVIACVNAAALVMARLRTRHQDFAVRQALGASRGALAAQVLTESALLGAAAAVAGGALAALTMVGVREVIPRTVPRWDSLTVGWSLLVYAGLFGFAGLFATGLGLVWKVTRTSVTPVIRAASAQGGKAEGAASRLVLAAAQMALTVMLAFGGIQLARSADALGDVDLGFNPHVLTVRAGYDFRRYAPPEARADLYTRVKDRVAQVPGVVAAGVTTHVPLSGATMMDGYEADLSKEPSFAQAANYQAVTRGYFETLQIPFRQGRDFTDVEVRTRQQVIVVDETLVQTVFPGETDVIGRTLRLGWGLENARIIGVVGHVRSIEVGRAVRPQIYTTVGNLFQIQNGGTITVRGTGDPMALRQAVEAAITEVGTGRAVGQAALLSDNVSAALGTLRAVTGLVTMLAIVAAGLSAAGLYIVIAYLVHERRRSAAIRTALGATRRQVIWSVVRSGGLALGVAIAVGAVGATAGGSALGDLLYRVGERDVLSLLAAVAATVIVSGVAMYLPARRAAAANVVKVLRES